MPATQGGVAFAEDHEFRIRRTRKPLQALQRDAKRSLSRQRHDKDARAIRNGKRTLSERASLGIFRSHVRRTIPAAPTIRVPTSYLPLPRRRQRGRLARRGRGRRWTRTQGAETDLWARVLHLFAAWSPGNPGGVASGLAASDTDSNRSRAPHEGDRDAQDDKASLAGHTEGSRSSFIERLVADQESGLHDPEIQKSYYFVDTGLIAGSVYFVRCFSWACGVVSQLRQGRPLRNARGCIPSSACSSVKRSDTRSESDEARR